jgi:hypothetical protein
VNLAKGLCDGGRSAFRLRRHVAELLLLTHVTAKNAWLLGQALFIAVYFAGALLSFNGVRQLLDAIPAKV